MAIMLSIWSLFREASRERLGRYLGWREVIVGVGVAVTCRTCWQFLHARSRRAELHRKRAEARLELTEKCESLRRKLQSEVSEREVRRISELSPEKLSDGLRSGDLNPEHVIKAYQLKALEVNQELNCLAHIILEAENWSSDRNSLSHAERGLLHGVPISVKEYKEIKGYDSHFGLATLLGEPALNDHVFVQVLKAHGAVPFVKSNIPQLSQSFETQNPILGRTLHPADHSRTPGGSSGGEAALIASGGSPLGIGTDLGGSIRVPAHFCGICGLKPTSKRLSQRGGSIDDGKTILATANGPLSRDVGGLILAMKALASPIMFQLDPLVPALPFQDKVLADTRKLRIGYFVDNGIFTPLPPCQRAVRTARTALQKAGHELIEVELASGEDILDAITDIYIPARGADRLKTERDLLKYDVMDSCLSDIYAKVSYPEFITKIISFILKYKDPYRARFWTAWRAIRSSEEWWNITIKYQKFLQSYTNKWRNYKLDAVICPPAGYIAMPHGTTYLDGAAFTYTRLYNLLDFPAGVLPVTRVNEEDQREMTSYPRHGDYEAGHEAMVNASGLPVGVQVVTLPFQEELCLRIMAEIENIVNYQ